MIFCFAKKSFPQNNDDYDQSKNAMMASVWGYSKSIIGVVYERFFNKFSNEHIMYSARTGIAYNPAFGESNYPAFTSVPLLLSALFGGNKSFMQLSGGYTATFSRGGYDSTQNPPVKLQKYESSYILSLSYRYIRNQGATFEIMPLTLIWTDNPNEKFTWTFGASLGITF